jgi:maleylpyruvate isomerase
MGSPDRHLGWMSDGYQYFTDQLARIDDAQLAEPSALPNWTRKHVIAHIGFNARALRRLVHWADTGETTPMYANAAEREDEIAEGARWSSARLRDLVPREQGALTNALQGLSSTGWSAEVVTGQGRRIAASEIPWLRTRELWIHAVDLDNGGAFVDLPAELVDELIVDALAKRRGDGQSPMFNIKPTDRGSVPPGPTASSNLIVGRASDLASWLTGRGSREVRTADGAPLPQLGPWL